MCATFFDATTLSSDLSSGWDLNVKQMETTPHFEASPLSTESWLRGPRAGRTRRPCPSMPWLDRQLLRSISIDIQPAQLEFTKSAAAGGLGMRMTIRMHM